MKEILLTNSSLITLVNDEDYFLANLFKWRLYVKRNKYLSTYYACTCFRHENIKYEISLHRFLLNAQRYIPVDHKNGNGLDNQRLNIRICTKTQNNMNVRKWPNTSSQYKGVSWQKKAKKWEASIRFNYKLSHLGYFVDEKIAAMAYDRKALELFGDFAKLNFENLL